MAIWTPTLTLLAALLCGIASDSHAQGPPPEPPALTAARAEFLSQVVAGSRQLTEQFTNALTKLEDELAANGDYEDAMRVQARRKEVDSSMAAAPQPAASPGIAMPAAVARTSSSVVLEGDALTGWRTAGSYAEWTMQKLTPGRYAVQLSYVLGDARAPANGEPSLPSRFTPVEVAKFKISEVSVLATATANTRLLELNRSKDPATFTAAGTEPLVISRASITLRLEAMQSYAANTVRIRDIRLVPADDKSPAPIASTALAATGVKDVETLKQLFTKQFSAARAPLIVDYQARLRTLAAQPSVSKDRDLLEEIEAEQKRAATNATAVIGTASARKRPASGVGSGLDGFEDLVGAQLVVDAANTGDRFRIEHGGRQFWVRLAWVRSPPPEPEDKDALQMAMKHFKIEEDEALAVGRMAREFTLGYLEDRPLRLLVRSKKIAADEAAPALVFLDDLGLFQTVLVDRGLAAVALPPGSEHKPTIETGMMRLLTEHEQKAAKRRPAPGAWSFRAEEAR